MNINLIVSASVLVLSFLVLVFWIFYSIILLRQVQKGNARKDWKISMVFYIGIVLLVLADIVFAASQLYSVYWGQNVFEIVELVSLMVFVIAFYLRMENVTKIHPPI